MGHRWDYVSTEAVTKSSLLSLTHMAYLNARSDYFLLLPTLTLRAFVRLSWHGSYRTVAVRAYYMAAT